MTNVHHVVFLYCGWTGTDADDINAGVRDAVDWDAWTPGVSAIEKDGVTCTLSFRVMENGRGEMTRAISVNVSFLNGRPDINTDVFERAVR